MSSRLHLSSPAEPDAVLWRSTAGSHQSSAELRAMTQYLKDNRLPVEQVTSVECYRESRVLKLRVEMHAVTGETTPPWEPKDQEER